ncbi:SOS-response repressor and protease LexA [hydrothermal vent metagenome]|uniref:SOS-response repressor and protease LexA n=1 Tax=hydrothermal vent metagenome TaxID=652676 RepID=A0A3B1AEC9_9ZZZZ
MLSTRQKDAFQFICDYIAEYDQGPLLTEIAQGLGIQSKGVVHRYVQALAVEGLIDLLPGRHRGIRLQQANESGLPSNLPFLGRIAAGKPIEAIPGADTVDLSEFFMGPDRFVLKVQGDSMVDAGILDGDMVVIEQCSCANDGDIVVALIDNDEATLKYLHHDKNGDILLIPANTAMSAMHFSPERVAIQGVLVGQMRNYR